ncbi:DUF1963 domain-containing protein [Bradyrhizobium guangdongense]|nr:DUF1963 domain-containing protein [Bradyrhizobium guangdongense]GGI29003.1 hypothetical protein GCM10010987_52230 [Bradyrhizobium guangdongense]
MALSSNFNKPFGDPSNYPPAAGDEDIRALLHRTADESAVFKHQFPPRFPISGRTYFGGLPTAPADFRWPRAPDGTPYSFMAQVDCAELPDFQLRKFLPASGVLHFFVNWDVFDGLDEAQSWPNHVVLSRDTTEPCREVRPPDDLPPCYGASNARFYFPWLEHTDRHDYPRAFARKAMTMGVVRTFAEEHPRELDGNSAGRYQQIWEEEQAAELARFYGDPVIADALPGPKDDFAARRTVQRPTTTFPAGWIDIEVFCGLFLKEVLERGIKQIERGKDAAGQPWPVDPAAVRAAYENALTTANGWIERSRSAGLTSPVPEADRMAFWSWLEEMNAAAVDPITDSRCARVLNQLSWKTVRTGAHICLSASEAASSLVPEEMMGELRMEHSVLVAGKWPRRAGRHQMLGAGRDVQGAPRRHTLAAGDPLLSDVLLLQLDTDWAVPWMLADCGVLQYWISVSDLRAERFDRVRVTIEGH